MNYAQSKLFKIQLLTQGAFIALFCFWNINQQVQAIFGGLFLCLVGIPHGANDYLYRQDVTAYGVSKFLFSYLGSMLVYLGLWYFAPAIALVVFFAFSFHHFGQSNFQNPSVWYLPSVLWGIWILLLPVMLHLNEALGIFTDMISFSELGKTIFSSGNILFANWSLWHLAILLTVAVLYIVSLFLFERKNLYLYLLQFSAVSIWYVVTPLLFGFITVFCLWHASQSLHHQAVHFQRSFKKSATQFAKAMVPFSLLALLVFGLYVYYSGFKVSEAFVLLSLISFPHIVVMHRLYAHA